MLCWSVMSVAADSRQIPLRLTVRPNTRPANAATTPRVAIPLPGVTLAHLRAGSAPGAKHRRRDTCDLDRACAPSTAPTAQPCPRPPGRAREHQHARPALGRSSSCRRARSKSGTSRRREVQAYEERLLCVLQLLRDPSSASIYVTSSPIAPAIVDHYLSLLPARLRGRAPSPDAAVGERCDERVAQREGARAAELLTGSARDPGPRPAHLVPYDDDDLERDLALALGIPMYGADPRHVHLGTKSGCRELFAAPASPHPLGVERIAGMRRRDRRDRRLRARRPEIAAAVVKLNEGVSGEGNAIVDLRGLPAPGRAATSAPPSASASRHGARGLEPSVSSVPRPARRARRHRRGADHRRRGPQPERRSWRSRRRRGRDRVDARPAARRPERAELPRLLLPRRARVREPDHRDRPAGRRRARADRRDRPVRDRLRRRARPAAASGAGTRSS